MQYPITQGGEEIGVAYMHVQGLYYLIRCRCMFGGTGFHRVMLSNGQKEWDLGICVPENGGFQLEKRIPKKEIGEGKYRFYIRKERNAEKRCFAAVHPDRPFAHLDILNAAVYGEENEEVGLLWD